MPINTLSREVSGEGAMRIEKRNSGSTRTSDALAWSDGLPAYPRPEIPREKFKKIKKRLAEVFLECDINHM